MHCLYSWESHGVMYCGACSPGMSDYSQQNNPSSSHIGN
uniref:Uncharacterized protein n=1 Tax=Anguilla anguilla TaxID=7936 RepID=A0A0E9VKX4_ANGAN